MAYSLFEEFFFQLFNQTIIIIKTPITYYGGKQSLAVPILSLLSMAGHHTGYIEAFCGGAAIFFAKKPSTIEVINDLNGEVANFYEQLKTNFEALQRKIFCTLHSFRFYKDAQIIYENPHLFSKLDRAWAFWVLASQSYCSSINAGFSFSKNNKNRASLTIHNKRKAFLNNISERLALTTIENNCALKVITRYDAAENIFYLDPPYVGTNQGHYKGYSFEDYQNLLNKISSIKGKFILSSYPTDMLSDFVSKYKWKQIFIHRKLSIQSKKDKNRTEVLTYNF